MVLYVFNAFWLRSALQRQFPGAEVACWRIDDNTLEVHLVLGLAWVARRVRKQDFERAVGDPVIAICRDLERSL